MKTLEDEAFDDLAQKQGMWGGGFQAKRAAAADKLKPALVWPENKTFSHWSDCAVHNGPAYPAGPCDCGVAQEPTEWRTMEVNYPFGKELDIRMGDGSILCDVLPQREGDLWWSGSGTGEKFIDPKYADITHWRIHSNTAPPPLPAQEPVACERCKQLEEQAYDLLGQLKVANLKWSVAHPWVGLTDEEINDCIKFPNRNLFARDGTTSQRIARATEAKLKERNHGT